jgi:uncharacterized protein (DUF2267 family)
MAEQQEQQAFLEKVMQQSNLQTVNEAQTATKVVFRILRDMVDRDTSDNVADELREEAPEADMEIKDLWKDTNPMVSFFSRISPARPLKVSPGVFMLRLQQEGALPSDTEPQQVAKAVFSATKDELSEARIQEVAGFLPDDIRQLWVAA